jgi:Xaa-Pro aminopeptidase
MTSRSNRIAAALDKAELDGAICFLPENVLFFTGYWPSTGDSALIISKKGSRALIIPSVDQHFVASSWNGLLVPYDVDPADVRSGSPREKLIQSIKAAIHELGLNGGNLGCELSFENVAGSFRGSEANIPGKELFKALSSALPRMNFKDFSDLIRDLRRIKTRDEIESLRRCNQIAAHAFARARERAQPGIKEIEVAAAIESSFQEFGVGYEGTYRARGYAFAMSGQVNSGNAWLPANFSTNRVLQDGTYC